MATRSRSNTDSSIPSPMEDYREMPIDVEGLEDPLRPRTLPRPQFQRPPRILEMTDEGIRVVMNGLQLSLKGHKQPFITFSYALIPPKETPIKVDSKILTSEGVECQHIRYHQLQHGDDPSSLAGKYRKSHAVGIIFVNLDDSYTLAPEFTLDPAAMPTGGFGTLKSKKGGFPMVVITSEDGRHLKEYLDRYDPGELHAKIESKNMDLVELAPQHPLGASYSPTLSQKGGNKSRHGIRRSLRYLNSRSKLAINLKEEIKQLIFPPSGPVCVSEDEGLFKVVMSTFYQHEQMVQREGHHGGGGGAVFHKLCKHMEEMFPRDFPFYLLVAYRAHRKQQLYLCDELSQFVHNCIERFERLEQPSVVKTLENFHRMDNFKIMFDPNNALCTVFELLEEACIELMKVSFTSRSQDSSPLPHRHIYFRMVWITVAFKCHVERGARDFTDLWAEHLTGCLKPLYLTTETIHDIKKGVEFGRLLQLPEEVSFTSDHMADLLAPEGPVRPFNQMKEFVMVLEPYVQLEEDFVRNLVRRPRESYERCFKQGDEERLRAMHPEGNLLVILQESLGFLDTVLEVCRKRHWRSSETDEEMKRWLSLLLQLVDITGERVESYLKDFLTTKTGGVTKQYSEHIKREVILKLEDNFSALSVKQFLQLYKAFFIWPNWVVEHYLTQYKIPQGVKVCSPTWSEFFAEFVDRFTDAQHHKFLLQFLKSVAACYLEQGRARDFVLDLLQLDVPRLFVMESEGSSSTFQNDLLATSVPEEFTNFLTDYIQRNGLRKEMLMGVETIWESIVDNSDFQQLILSVLQQELIPESINLHGTLSQPVKYIVQKCVSAIAEEIAASNLLEMTSRLHFCWGIVASCCSRIPISDNFEWIRSYYFLIQELSRIYAIYCGRNGLEESGCVLKEGAFPPDIVQCPFDEVKAFFKWVFQAHQSLVLWNRKLKSNLVNYDDILLYGEKFSNITMMAPALLAESLVIDKHDVQALKLTFLQNFELLNLLLLRYIPGEPEHGWCSLQHLLAKYGVGLPSHLLVPLKKHVSFPGEITTATKHPLSLEHPPVPSVTKNFHPGHDITLAITRELTLHDLRSLVQALDSFLWPVHGDGTKLLDILIFFFLCDSEIFDKYLKLELKKVDMRLHPSRHVRDPPAAFLLPVMVIERQSCRDIPLGITMTMLADALSQTQKLLLRLIHGSASYNEIIADGSLRLTDIDREFDVLNRYARFAGINTRDNEGLKGVKAMLQLFQFTRHIQTIHNVCQQYQLDGCLEDPVLQELTELIRMLEEVTNRDSLTARDAIEKMERVSSSLCLSEGQSPKFLYVFSAISDSTVFHQFVVEKQFVGETGGALFHQQYQLITTQLQHEEYNEVVLNHLFAAFRFMAPFTDRTQDFCTLMRQVSGLNAYDAWRQLETVNRNINLIRLWFSRAEGDTLQGVATELDRILTSGHYCFVFSSGPEAVASTVELHYCPLAITCLEQPSRGGGMEEEGGAGVLWGGGRLIHVGEVVRQCWNEEQISDFVRKLGFLDKRSESDEKEREEVGGREDPGEQINRFLHLNQTAKKLLDLYSKLRELGHPDYLQPVLHQVLECSLSQEEADEMVYEAVKTVSAWEKDVAELRTRYEQLLFFAIPKLLHLHRLITAPEPDLEAIVQEVCFLFQNTPSVRKKLKSNIGELLSQKERPREMSGSQPPPPTHGGAQDTPMHVVGDFLASLFRNYELSSHSLKKRRPSTVLSQTAPGSPPTHILHSCQGYTQAHLMRLIISIYGGVPEAFEVFHCRATTTEEELRLFLSPQRATKRPFQYLILEVNRLPYPLQEALLRLHFDLRQCHMDQTDVPCIHFIETAPSLLQEMPWILHRDYKGIEPTLDFSKAMVTCKKSALNPDDFSCIQLVYGQASDGKTHYIQTQLKQCPRHVNVAISEVFTPLSAIKKLSTLPSDESGCAVFFNFLILPPGESVDENERHTYEQLIESIGWFFFDLFILGYVEDPLTGKSFSFPGGMQWAIYVEVPSRNQMDPERSLGEFFEDVPALGLIGTPHEVFPQTPYVVDEDAQLVCKYLKAFKVGGSKGIDRLYKEGSGFLGSRSKSNIPVVFSNDPELSDSECRKILDRYTPQHMKKNKTMQKLFVRYMKRRCAFLDNCPAFNFNVGSTEYVVVEGGQRKKNDTAQLGSTLMDTMLKEVSDFCDSIIREDWSLKPHHQLIYDFKDGGGTFGLMSLHPDQIPELDKEKFRRIGIEIPSMMELYSRQRLDSYLSRALDVPLNSRGHLTPIDNCGYVLTLDFAVKMLNIHERAECQIPVIIEGETGVGKTALVEMLSRLWNYSLMKNWNLQKERLLDSIRRKLAELPQSVLQDYQGCLEALNSGATIREDDLILIGELRSDTTKSKQFYSVLRQMMFNLIEDPVLSLIELCEEDQKAGMKLSKLFASAKYKDNVKDTAKLVFAFLNARVKSTFHKLNVHAALRPADIMEFFDPVFKQATELSLAYEDSGATKVPFVSVFLDEVNTSSCLGIFKEIIVDRTLDGQPIPSNLFIIGACNPHRGNSLAALDTWVRGTYYVRELHPSLQCLMWDYGALGEIQEQDYIHAKMKMVSRNSTNADLTNLTDLIVTSQKLMRKYAFEQFKSCGMPEPEAYPSSRSCVSQRDIQRVFTFYGWLMRMYQKFLPYGQDSDYSSRAVAVSLGLVYYLRLDSKHRIMYRERLDHETRLMKVTFSRAFEQELNWYIDHVNLPEGIAKTQALKENLFTTIVSTMTHTPLIMVGAPGSSKTLSFNLAIANLKGEESKISAFRETEIFRSLDPHYYQCSRRTTSNEIQTVFSRAINRQRSHLKVPLPVNCVVFMDEAGLPEERHESLKVLHYYLDKSEVSFVAVSNHVLDAAKTNRAVSLYRPEASEEDLITLAKGCLCTTPDTPPPELKKDVDIVTSFCPAYMAVMNKPQFEKFFGLRDFIHFISYLRRKRMEMLSPQLVMEALERNFNGLDGKDFHLISQLFLRAVHSSPDKVELRNILQVLHSSLNDHAISGAENEVRYKLIIDPSEDGSLVRLLFSSGVLKRENTKVYVCSDFPGDAQLQRVNTIAAIRHSANEGHTVVLSQTDSVHESFYDLFNRRFHRIDANTGPRYYANISIGAHIKPCRVHPDFECVVVVKHSELENIPPPFLNRFEKYYLSHERILEAALSQLPPCLGRVVSTAQEKAEEFLDHIGSSASIYGLHKDTVNSLVLTLLPPSGHLYRDPHPPPFTPTLSPSATPLSPSPMPARATGVATEESGLDRKLYLLETLLASLRDNAGFHIPVCSPDELRLDAEEVFAHIQQDAEFAGHISQLTPPVVLEAVNEALHSLYTTPLPSSHDTKTNVSVNACLVVTVLTQWLIRHLCKRLTQLMTSESLCMYHKKIPTSYIQNYLNHQHHFSLKRLLESQRALLDQAEVEDGRGEERIKPSCATKLLCFTRSSQLLHRLPTQYPSVHHPSPSSPMEDDSLLRELVFSNLEQLVVHKLSTVTTYTSMNEFLRTYLASETQSLLLLVVNMQETSKEVVNHLRIMIEEVESEHLRKSQGNRPQKLFAVLLHFPSSRLTSPCYPSMFLRGWDFHYLDIIGYSAKEGGILDIRDWFRQCYFTSSVAASCGAISPEDSVTLQLQNLLEESVQVVSSRVNFRSHKASSFNCPMSLPERNSALKELFFHKGVGDVLCERFRSYWHPSVMVEYLEKAASFAHQHETTLNVVDSLQFIFKSLFFDFLVYMVSKINEGMNIDVLFNRECSPAVQKLFLDLLRVYPIPKLSELRMLGIASGTDSHVRKTKESFCPPRFPFFSLVSAQVEKLIDQSRREVNQQQVEWLCDRSEPRHVSLFQSQTQRSQLQTMADMLELVTTKLEELSSKYEERSVIAVTLHALLNGGEELWQRYLEDFTHHKLHLDFGSTGISHKILRVAFGKLEEQAALQRLAILHVYVHIHKLNLAKVVSVLRPLDRIEIAASILPSLSVRSPTQSFLHNVEHSGDFLGRPEALSVFIIDTLFSAITGIAMGYRPGGVTSDPPSDDEGVVNGELPGTVVVSDEEGDDEALEHLRLWYKVYRDVVSMPTLREHIYRSRSEVAEAQHNVMHTLFLVLRSKPTLLSHEDLRQGFAIFNTVFNRFFWSSTRELRGQSPRLGDITIATLKSLTGTTELQSVFSRENPQVRHTIEGLFDHFFSEHLSSFNSEDVRCFLKIANQQSHWQTTFLMDEVIGVEYSEDLSQFELNPEMDGEAVHKLASCVPMAVFKVYLYRILQQNGRSRAGKGGRMDSGPERDPSLSVLFLFAQKEVHSLVIEVLDGVGGDEVEPGPYIPTFYQYCGPIKSCPAANNQLMQQPLAHLYFMTVLENLHNSNYSLASLIKAVTSLTKQCKGGSVPDKDRVLLYIEKQAVVQVMITVLAQHLDLRKDSKVHSLCDLLSDLNTILDDTSMGGGSSMGGHGLVLAMHMLRELHSFKGFTSMLTDQYKMLCDGINCLMPFHAALCSVHVPNSPSSRRTERPFLPYPEMGSEFLTLYQRVCTALTNVHTSHGSTAKVKELTRVADECNQPAAQLIILSPSGDSFAIGKAACFKMAVWLGVYNEFFCKKKPSQVLSQVIRNIFEAEPQVARLLSAFLYPEYMIRKAGSSEPYHDYIYNLFMPASSGPENPSDTDLRTAMVHMVAVVLGSLPHSNHLWYHMFAPEELTDTHVTGFMYNTTVGPASQLYYDQGVELTDDGIYGKHSYLTHATRGTLNLHSLYLLLWANFAAFSVGLLTQQGAEGKLEEGLISEGSPGGLSVRQYCAGQLQKMWGLVRSGLGISDDERAFLVRGCLNQLFELGLKTQADLKGRLQTPTELDRYEEMWHSFIFTPRWSCLREEFTQSNDLVHNQVFEDIRCLDKRYPWFPSQRTLTQTILSMVDLSDPSSNELYPLSRFVVEYPRLRVGGDLLPGIVELYQWLHTELAYAITYEEARTITLGRLANVIAKRFSGDRKQRYEKLKVLFNEYVHLSGCTRLKRPVTIGDDTAILHLLSYTVDGEQENDLLYCVITDVINFHNRFLSTLLEAMKSSSLSTRYFPEEPPRVHVMEFTQQYRLVGRSRSTQTRSELLQLIHSRSHLPDAFPMDPRSPSPSSQREISHTRLPGQMDSLIDVSKLQEDILGAYIAGKPLIDPASISSIRMPFKFREDDETTSLHLSLRDSAVDSISQKLPKEFKVPLEDTRKRLEYEFHSAGYHAIMEVVTGLRTAVAHLVKEIAAEGSTPTTVPTAARQEELQPLTLREFLVKLYEIDPTDDSRDVFHQIGIHSLTPSQHLCLEGLRLPFLSSTLCLFVQWAEEGWYDFCSLPFATKMQMSLLDEDALRNIPSQYKGSYSELLRELKSLVEVLVHMEGSIAKMAKQNAQQPIVKYLKGLQILSIEDKFVSMIPETVQLEHYVSLRLILRKLISEVQKQVTQSDVPTPEAKPEVWDDFVPDFWELKLPHFRQRAYVYSRSTSTCQVGGLFLDIRGALAGMLDRQNSHSSEILNDLIHYSSETNLLVGDSGDENEVMSSGLPSLPPSPQKPPSEEGPARHSVNSRVLLRKLSTQFEEELKQRASRFNQEDVTAFLHTITLDQYITAFEEYEINGELLIQFKDEELKEMGVLSALHRLKIRFFFRRQVLGSQDFAEQYPPPVVAAILEGSKQLKQFASSFLGNAIDGELLVNASDEVMKELGVEKGVHMRMIRSNFKTHAASQV